MVNEALLSKVPARVHPMAGESCDAAAYEQELRAVFANEPIAFDLAILGLGEDGHVASLFPGDPALDVTDRLAVHVQGADHSRITLTLPALSAARHVVFFVLGDAKADAVASLLSGVDIPAARIRSDDVIVVADAAAARLARQQRY
jgi:6-phosphogluconolactonase/glucosamine-6-phosphate isomerase/deaminase